ncbi:ABC transporter ATP-binding protein [Methylophilus aquaticus]|uniref:ATP-binding cassette domain-containing protein n=1 Tax=Methylophilus aquaticus TaxID=1971610 RepID=A0ABT9JP44_9PROT|nr:ATP-binding cassette domain-containing protein [Methylophilus aquaticus]MDP8566359.1 ATP-binding cassette domain-containing protein [Methylophilus aquaticus]
MIMIEAIDLSKRFEHSSLFRKTQPGRPVLDRVSLRAEDACITALLGPNGAGKTTFLRMLAGLEKPEAGSILIQGQPAHLHTAKFAYLSDGCGLYPRLTGEENIRYFGALYGLSDAHITLRIQTLDSHLGFAHVLAKKAGACSLGERMRIALARALVHDPHTLVLDEPTNGLDLASVRKLRNFLRYLASEAGGGKCILLSTHHLHEVEMIADQVIVLVQGQVKATGSVRQITVANAAQHFEDAFAALAFGETISCINVG